MTVDHVRATLSLFVTAHGAAAVDPATLKTFGADVVDTLMGPVGSETGADANRASKAYALVQAMTALQVLALDLTSLTDLEGAALSFAAVKAIWIKNTGATSIDLVSTNGIVGSCTLKAGQSVCVSTPASGFTVTNGASDGLTFTNGNGAGSFRLVIVGS